MIFNKGLTLEKGKKHLQFNEFSCLLILYHYLITYDA